MPLFLSLLSLLAVKAATVTLNWKIGWIDNVNPDNAHPRRAIGVNGAWPVPPVHVMLFDTLVINVINALDVATCSLF
jgi:iron transport multicopper oxidase